MRSNRRRGSIGYGPDGAEMSRQCAEVVQEVSNIATHVRTSAIKQLRALALASATVRESSLLASMGLS